MQVVAILNVKKTTILSESIGFKGNQTGWSLGC